MDYVMGGTECVCVRVCEVEVHTQTHTYLAWEKFQQKRAQKNDAQALWIQFTLHQTDAERAEMQTQRHEVK